MFYPIPTHVCYRYKLKYSINSNFFAYPASLSCLSNSINICTVAVTNIRNMHTVSTNQIADILHYNNQVDQKSSIQEGITTKSIL